MSARSATSRLPAPSASEPLPSNASPPSWPGAGAAAPLRIGLVTHYMLPHIGGIETQAEAIFNHYLEAGLAVRWVASRVPADTPAQQAGRIRVGCSNLTETRLGVPWPIWGPEGVRAIAKLVAWADIVHVHDCLYLGSALAVHGARRAHKPSIVSQHIGFVEYSSAGLNAIERLAYGTLGRSVLRSAAHVVCCTPAAEEFVPTLVDKPAGGLSVIPYGTDTRRFRKPTAAERAGARRRLGVPQDARVVLFVGRLVEKKGVRLFVEVCQRTPAHHFLMIGDGPLRSLVALDQDNLTWHSLIPADEMHIAYHAADVFLLPSHGEGFPLAIHEAMAAHLPVIAPRGEAFTSVLERAEACVVAERTTTALCEALQRLVQSPELAAAVGRSGGELVQREWSVATMGERYVSLARRLAGNP